MVKYILINNERVQCSPEQETELENLGKKRTERKAIRLQKEQDEKDNKASGKAKLKAGEALTDAEISALFGD